MGEFSPVYPVNPKAIKLGRDSRGLSMREVAKMIGITAGQYSQIERGKKEISPELLTKLSQALKYTESFFREPVVIIYPINSLDNGSSAYESYINAK